MLFVYSMCLLWGLRRRRRLHHALMYIQIQSVMMRWTPVTTERARWPFPNSSILGKVFKDVPFKTSQAPWLGRLRRSWRFAVDKQSLACPASASLSAVWALLCRLTLNKNPQSSSTPATMSGSRWASFVLLYILFMVWLICSTKCTKTGLAYFISVIHNNTRWPSDSSSFTECRFFLHVFNLAYTL